MGTKGTLNVSHIDIETMPLWGNKNGGVKYPPWNIALPIYDFDLRSSHARTLLPAALASVSSGFVLAGIRVRGVS